MLETYLLLADSEEEVNEIRTSFHGSRPPAISISKYFKRLESYMKCSEECYVLALIYIDRITSRILDFKINSLCIHRLVLTGVAVAAKFSEDRYFKNSYYAKVGGISNKEFNMLEMSFLIYLDFKLFVSAEEYEKYYKTLITNFGVGKVNELQEPGCDKEDFAD